MSSIIASMPQWIPSILKKYVYVITYKQVLVANLIVNVRVYPLLEERGKLVNINSAMVTKFQQLFLLGSLKSTKK